MVILSFGMSNCTRTALIINALLIADQGRWEFFFKVSEVVCRKFFGSSYLVVVVLGLYFYLFIIIIFIYFQHVSLLIYVGKVFNSDLGGGGGGGCAHPPCKIGKLINKVSEILYPLD